MHVQMHAHMHKHTPWLAVSDPVYHFSRCALIFLSKCKRLVFTLYPINWLWKTVNSATGTHKSEDGRSGGGVCDIEFNNTSYLQHSTALQLLRATLGIFRDFAISSLLILINEKRILPVPGSYQT